MCEQMVSIKIHSNLSNWTLPLGYMKIQMPILQEKCLLNTYGVYRLAKSAAFRLTEY